MAVPPVFPARSALTLDYSGGGIAASGSLSALTVSVVVLVEMGVLRTVLALVSSSSDKHLLPVKPGCPRDVIRIAADFLGGVSAVYSTFLALWSCAFCAVTVTEAVQVCGFVERSGRQSGRSSLCMTPLAFERLCVPATASSRVLSLSLLPAT